MAADRYTQWLKIAPGERPPDHYSLLGLPPFCDDARQIEQASHDRLDQLDKHALSPDAASRAECQRIMNEVARARVVLMDAGKRKAHDLELAAKLGIAPPQVVVMPAQASELRRRHAQVAREEPAEEVVKPAVGEASRSMGRWGGVVVGMMAVVVLLIILNAGDGDAVAPLPAGAPTTAGPDSQRSGKDGNEKAGADFAVAELEQARSRCMALLRECQGDKSIMPLIEEWGQRDWQYILRAVEQAEDVGAATMQRVVEYEKASAKLGEVMAHARRTAQILRSTRGPYDEAAAVMDEGTIRTHLPVEWALIQRSLRSATIGGLNHREDHARQHFEQAAKLYQAAAAKARSMNLVPIVPQGK